MTSIKLINLAIPHTFRHPKEWTIDLLFKNNRIRKHGTNFKTAITSLPCGRHRYIRHRYIRHRYVAPNSMTHFLHSCAHGSLGNIHLRRSHVKGVDVINEDVINVTPLIKMAKVYSKNYGYLFN